MDKLHRFDEPIILIVGQSVHGQEQKPVDERSQLAFRKPN